MKQPYAAVIGGVNLDICGRSARKLIPEDSNPGTVTMSPGGVGRNIAHNLCLLSVETVFVTALGGDPWSHRAEAECRALGMNLDYAVHDPAGSISIYMFLTEPDGNMALALSDTAIAKRLTPAVLEERLDVLNGAGAVVMDTNLEPESIRFLAEHCTAPLFADPVSVGKADKLRPVLGRLHTLKPNRMEAEYLSGVEIRDEKSLFEAADRLLGTGLGRVVISLGSRGALLAEGETRIQLPCYPTKLVNVTGGGDAMMAALTYGHLAGRSLEESGKLALAAGSMAVQCSVTNNPELSVAALEKRIKGECI